MRLLLIMPDACMHKLVIGPLVRSMREMPLTICTLAALTPEIPGLEIKLIDGSVEKVPLDYPADLVGISAITGCANYAYELAGHFRGRGIPVVLGGIHVSILPGEALRHADAIVIGRAEASWPRLLADFARGALRRVYREEPATDDWLRHVPAPRRDLHNRHGYMISETVQATRGCRRTCDFCTVPVVWPRHLKRPVVDVIRDIRLTRSKYISFNDVSLVEDPEYAKELFTAMIPLKKQWGGLVTVDFEVSDDLLALMARSGCRYLLLGFESDDRAVLRQIAKGFNRPIDYRALLQRLHAARISVQGCFVFGFDHDDASTFARTVELVNDLKIDIPRYSLYTPYPGTVLFKRLLAEQRIISFNWNDYDTMHVVIKPAQMSPEELYTGFKWAYRETFKMKHIVRRLPLININTTVNFFGNLAYRIFVRRLYHDPRFATPYSYANPGQAPAAADYMVPDNL